MGTQAQVSLSSGLASLWVYVATGPATIRARPVRLRGHSVYNRGVLSRCAGLSLRPFLYLH